MASFPHNDSGDHLDEPPDVVFLVALEQQPSVLDPDRELAARQGRGPMALEGGEGGQREVVIPGEDQSERLRALRPVGQDLKRVSLRFEGDMGEFSGREVQVRQVEVGQPWR